MRDNILLTITVITDDDTGIYQIGDLDFEILSACRAYLENSVNRKKLADWLEWLSQQCRDGKPPFEPSLTEAELRDFS